MHNEVKEAIKQYVLSEEKVRESQRALWNAQDQRKKAGEQVYTAALQTQSDLPEIIAVVIDKITYMVILDLEGGNHHKIMQVDKVISL